MLSKGIEKQSHIIPLNYHLLMFPKINISNSTVCDINLRNFENIQINLIQYNCYMRGGEPVAHTYTQKVISSYIT